MLRDPKKTIDDLCAWIFAYMEKVGKNSRAVIGISGGKDSSVIATLCVRSLGKERVLGILMPDGIQRDFRVAEEVTELLGIEQRVINIQNIVKSIFETLSIASRDGKSSDLARLNIPPRVRMTVLYAVAQSLPVPVLVVNTSNASERYVGYSTKFGDGAGDFSPLGNFLVEEVLQLGRALALPTHLVEKTPHDGLSNKTDEEKLGFTYAQLDAYIKEGRLHDQSIAEKILYLHKKNLHKQEKMPIFSKIDRI